MTLALLDVEFVQQKLAYVIEQIGQINNSEFPYEEPRAALTVLRDFYKTDIARLAALDGSTDNRVRQQACAHANARISKYYPLLGFLLRATNVRNAFEVYAPLLGMCRTIYGADAKLVVSSEWQFSPFTFPAVTDEFPALMFIGLPSTEGGNSLIVPLAGHELGHSVWRKKNGRTAALANIDRTLQSELTKAFHANWSEFQRVFNTTRSPSDLLTDLFLRGIWTQSYKLANRQIEELFCDVLGLRLFGESFLYSFIYLIAPNIGDRAPFYPSLASRSAVLSKASVAFGTDVPAGFNGYFFDPDKRLPPAEEFLLRMSDSASTALSQDLIDAVLAHVASTTLTLPTDAERDRIVTQFQTLSPAHSIVSVGDIINAGWKIRLRWDLWSSFDFDPKGRLEILNDLVFKTMEVMEFEAKTAKVQSA